MESPSIISYNIIDIIKGNGFKDITPHINILADKIFTKNGLLFRFLGWKKPDEIQKNVCVEETNNKILKIACPICGNVLNNYNFFDDGKNMFWCQNCKHEILITKK